MTRARIGAQFRRALPPVTARAVATAIAAFKRWAPLAAIATVTALTAGCTNEPAPRDTHATISDTGEISTFFYHMLLYLDIAIMAVVAAVWGLAIVRFKRAKGDDTLPVQNHGDAKMELIWTAIPTLIVIGITVPMLVGVFRLATRPDANQKVIEIDVTGKQWWWEFNYKGGEGHGIHTANEVHVEAGTAVVMNMTSSDVIHSWWVPRLTGKRDATPGRTYPLYFTAREPGIYDGQCAELCGASHALMGTKLFVHPPAKEIDVTYQGNKVTLESYGDWVRRERAPIAPPTAAVEAGARLFKDKTCATCHAIKGLQGAESAPQTSTSGPSLTHVGGRLSIAANALPNNPKNLAKWIMNPQGIKPGARMPALPMKPEEAEAIAQFLTSLK